MKKELVGFVVLTLFLIYSKSLLAQTLPDEINYPPYQQKYENLVQETESALAELDGAKDDLAAIRSSISNSLGQISALENENNFSNKFHKNVRKKTVPFRLNIIYDGEIIQTYKLEMKPYRALF